MATDFKTRSKFFAISKPTQNLLHKSPFVTLSEAKGLATIRKDEILHGVYPERKEQDSSRCSE
jgi:hypothetical protein